LLVIKRKSDLCEEKGSILFAFLFDLYGKNENVWLIKKSYFCEEKGSIMFLLLAD
jgi:hypothetical protein